MPLDPDAKMSDPPESCVSGPAIFKPQENLSAFGFIEDGFYNN